ncbi:MAG: GAF domain-containing protein [Leptospiraceae bacterium]|nr:GAF domain-containing protein [Leptospiraceae bacterium]
MAFHLFSLHQKKVNKTFSEKEENLISAIIVNNQGFYDVSLSTLLSEIDLSLTQIPSDLHNVFPESKMNKENKIHSEDIEKIRLAYEEYIKGIKKEYKVEFRQISENNSWKWILSQGTIIEWDKRNNPTRMLVTHTDITERKQSEMIQIARNTVLDELITKKDLKTILTEIIQNIESIHPEMRASIILLTPSGKLETGAAPSLPDFFNFAVNELYAGIGIGSCGSAAAIGELVIVDNIETHPYWQNYLDIAKKANLKACWSMPFKNDSGKVLGTFAAYYYHPRIPSEFEIKLIKEFSQIAGIAVQNNKNETDRIKAENEVKSLLIEKEILLKEVHHRIKNNMASVSSLLSLQSNYIDDPKVVKILEEAQNRILSMMLIYDKLYKSTDYKNISIKEYLSDLTDQIILSFPKNSHLTIEKDIEDFVINSKSLFSVGIILNELITNAYKYAFPENENGTIFIHVKKLLEDKIQLYVRDNGIGLPENFSISNSKGFGLNLINATLSSRS